MGGDWAVSRLLVGLVRRGEPWWLLPVIAVLLRRLREACREGVSLEGEAILGTKRSVDRRTFLPAAG